MLAVADLVEGIVAAAGGQERLEALRDLATEGEVYFGARLAPARFKEYYLNPDKLRTDMHFPNGMVTDACDGEAAWETEGLYGRPIDAVRFTVALAQRQLPLWLLSRLPAIRDQGLQAVHGRQAHVLEVADAQANPMQLAFAEEDLLLLRYEGKSYAVTAQTVATTLFTDYRPVDGYQIAFHTVDMMDDRVYQERFIESAQANRGIGPGLFQPPEGPG